MSRQIILETNRLYLREITPEDAETAYLLNLDPEVIKYTGDAAFESVEQAREFLSTYDHYKKYGFGRWGVIRKEDETFLGWCGLKYTAEDDEHDVGFRFFKKYWNMGYATEAAIACVKLGFEKHNMTQIVGRAMLENKASVKVLQKAGLEFYNMFDFDGQPGVIYKTEKAIWQKDKTKMAVDVFDKRADVYQEKYMDVSLYGDTLDVLINHLPQNARVLDVACGPGNIARYLLTKRRDLKILGIDLSPNIITLARSNNPAAEFKIMDARHIGQLNNNYEAIVCGFCLPYLSRKASESLIADAAKKLSPGGLLYLSTMEDDYTRSRMESSSSGDQLFMHFHEEGYLKEAMLQCGLKILHISRKQYPGRDGSTVTDLIIIARK